MSKSHQKPPLPERIGRKVRSMGWDTARHPERQTEDEDDADDEEMPEEAGNRRYDTSEPFARYEPIQTNREEDVIQIHTDGDEIPQDENIENKIRRSSQNTKRKRLDTVAHHLLESFGVRNKQYSYCCRFKLDHSQRNVIAPNHTQTSWLYARRNNHSRKKRHLSARRSPEREGKCNTVDPEWTLPTFGVKT